MSEILRPAINYSREGFPLSELIAYYWGGNVQILNKFPGFKEVYMPNGKAPAKGEIFKNPYLANTLELIAKKGRDVFYKGAEVPIGKNAPENKQSENIRIKMKFLA